MAGRPAAPPPQPAWRGRSRRRQTLRGSGHHPSPPVHLLAAMDHTSRAVLAQADADGTTNGIPSSSRYWTAWSSAARVITADALHAQHTHADWLVGVKHTDHTQSRGHRRVEILWTRADSW